MVGRHVSGGSGEPVARPVGRGVERAGDTDVGHGVGAAQAVAVGVVGQWGGGAGRTGEAAAEPAAPGPTRERLPLAWPSGARPDVDARRRRRRAGARAEPVAEGAPATARHRLPDVAPSGRAPRGSAGVRARGTVGRRARGRRGPVPRRPSRPRRPAPAACPPGHRPCSGTRSRTTTVPAARSPNRLPRLLAREQKTAGMPNSSQISTTSSRARTKACRNRSRLRRRGRRAGPWRTCPRSCPWSGSRRRAGSRRSPRRSRRGRPPLLRRRRASGSRSSAGTPVRTGP